VQRVKKEIINFCVNNNIYQEAIEIFIKYIELSNLLPNDYISLKFDSSKKTISWTTEDGLAHSIILTNNSLSENYWEISVIFVNELDNGIKRYTEREIVCRKNPKGFYFVNNEATLDINYVTHYDQHDLEQDGLPLGLITDQSTETLYVGVSGKVYRAEKSYISGDHIISSGLGMSGCEYFKQASFQDLLELSPYSYYDDDNNFVSAEEQSNIIDNLKRALYNASSEDVKYVFSILSRPKMVAGSAFHLKSREVAYDNGIVTVNDYGYLLEDVQAGHVLKDTMSFQIGIIEPFSFDPIEKLLDLIRKN
jgi:hypothetical protein